MRKVESLNLVSENAEDEDEEGDRRNRGLASYVIR